MNLKARSSFNLLLALICSSLALFLLNSCTDSNDLLNPANVSFQKTVPTEILTQNTSRVIYGPDSRKDLYQVFDAQMKLQARSTVALVYAVDVHHYNSSHVELSGSTLQDSYNLCSSELFLDQRNPAYCTGFLVDEQTIVTAGHCVLNEQECAATSFVFGFGIETLGQDYTKIHKSDVYSCGKLIHTESRVSDSDFAIIHLDRPVGTNRPPLPLRKKGGIDKQDLVTMIGHPLGLPLKVSSGRVTEVDKIYFSTTLDSFGGNSGAPVFNTIDGRIEGIFRGGEKDFVEHNGCYISKKCTETSCDGEVVTSISEVLPYL